MDLTLSIFKQNIKDLTVKAQNDKRRIIRLETDIQRLHTFLIDISQQVPELQQRIRKELLETGKIR